MGKASTDAPLYEIQKVVGTWEANTAPVIGCNDTDTAAFEGTAFPIMVAEVVAFSAGTGSAFAAAAAGLTFNSQPNNGDTLIINDGWGNSPVFRFHTSGTTPESGVPIVIGANTAATVVNTAAAINAYNDESASPENTRTAGRQLYLSATGGDSANVVVMTSTIPGTTSNSASFTASNTSSITTANPSGGAGTDTYASLWIDDQL